MGKGTSVFSKKKLLATLGGIIALAAVIFIASSLGSPAKKSQEIDPQNSPAVQAQTLAGQAQQALADGETSKAADLADKALELDKTNQTASQVLDAATTVVEEPTPASSAADEPEAEDATTRDDSAYDKAVDELLALLPARVDGWIAGQPLEQGDTAIITFEPTAGTDAYRKVVRATLTVHDLSKESAAVDFVTKVDKKLYAQDKSTVKVGVIPDAYFGTDGGALATIAFPRGRYAFEVNLNVPAGIDPASIKSLTATVASALPATR